jgi:hypothetical protein
MSLITEQQRIVRRPQRRNWRVCRIRMTGANFALLEKAAARRDVPPAILLDRVVGILITDDLINAVLDDKGGMPDAPSS